MISQIEEKIKSMPKVNTVAFWSTLFFGTLAHYYSFTNKITNHDDIRETCAELTQERWGRWFLAYSSDITGNTSMQFDCVLGLIFIAIAAVLIIAMLNIKSTVIAGLVGGFLGTFPTITFNNLYAGTADCYPLSILFMTIAAYIAIKAKRLWVSIVIPVIFMVFSLGIYQAYMGVALGLMIISGIIALVYEQQDFKTVILKEVKYLVTAVLGLIFYLITSKAIVKILGIEFDNYQNMDKMGTIDFKTLPTSIRHSYTKSLGYYLWNARGVHYRWLSAMFVILVLATVAALVFVIIKNKIGKLEIALSAVLLAVLPMASGFIYLEGANYIHLLIVYGFICLPMLPIVVMDRLSEDKTVLIKIYEGLGLFVFVMTTFNYITLANKVYTIDYYTYEESYSWAQTVSTVIRTTPGYSIDSTIYMVGLPSSNAQAVGEFYEDDPRTADFDGSGLRRDFNNQYSKNSFYWYFLGLTNRIEDIDMDDAEDLGVGDIEVFPSENSVRQIDGDIIIRFE